MDFKGKLDLVFVDKLIPFRIGYSLCTVYERTDHRIELWNFGYIPISKEFYFDKSIHLPKKIINYFDGAAFNTENINSMEALGIHYYLDIFVRVYDIAREEGRSAVEIEKQKKELFNFCRTLTKEKDRKRIV